MLQQSAEPNLVLYNLWHEWLQYANFWIFVTYNLPVSGI